MTEDFKISFLQAAQKEQAANVLSRAFNMAVSEGMSDLDLKYANDNNIDPVTFTASIGDTVVGVIRCAYQMPDYSSLFCLAVDPSYRQQGIGHALTQYAENYISREWMQGKPGIISLIDETKKENPSSMFYEKMGYEPVADEPLHDGCPVLYKSINAGAIPRQK